jgi:hypothetical protein
VDAAVKFEKRQRLLFALAGLDPAIHVSGFWRSWLKT